MAPPNEVHHSKKRKQRHVTNTLINVIDIDDSTTPNEYEELDSDNPNECEVLKFQDVQITHILTGSVTIGRAIENLVPLFPSNVYLSHPSVLSETHDFNITLSKS